MGRLFNLIHVVIIGYVVLTGNTIYDKTLGGIIAVIGYIYSFRLTGGLASSVGYNSGMSSMAGKMGKEMVVRSLSDANSVMALRLLAGTIAGSTEAVFDLLTYLVKKLTSKF